MAGGAGRKLRVMQSWNCFNAETVDARSYTELSMLVDSHQVLRACLTPLTFMTPRNKKTAANAMSSQIDDVTGRPCDQRGCAAT